MSDCRRVYVYIILYNYLWCMYGYVWEHISIHMHILCALYIILYIYVAACERYTWSVDNWTLYIYIIIYNCNYIYIHICVSEDSHMFSWSLSHATSVLQGLSALCKGHCSQFFAASKREKGSSQNSMSSFLPRTLWVFFFKNFDFQLVPLQSGLLHPIKTSLFTLR